MLQKWNTTLKVNVVKAFNKEYYMHFENETKIFIWKENKFI